MPSAFRGARPSHPRRACGRRAPLVLGGWMHGFPAPCPGGHPRIRRPPPRRAATFSLADGTKRQFGTVRRGLPGSLGLSWPRRRPKTPGRGRPPFPRGRGHRTKPPFCATSGRKGGGATPGTRSRRVRHAPARAPPQGRLRGEARCGRGPLAARPGALRRLPATLPPAAPPRSRAYPRAGSGLMTLRAPASRPSRFPRWPRHASGGPPAPRAPASLRQPQARLRLLRSGVSPAACLSCRLLSQPLFR